jgi:hypothetical protein
LGVFRTPSGVATDRHQYVSVADTANDRIQKFDQRGGLEAKWGSSGSGDGQFDHPTGITVDGAGHVYVADTGNNRIQEFTSTGDFIAKWGSSGSGNGQFNQPEDVATDGAGNVYVADMGNHRIQEFAPRVGMRAPTAAVQALRGKVRAKCQGDRKPMRVRAARQISPRCLVDTRRGTVRLISPKGTGSGTQSGKFRGGAFRLSRLATKHHHTRLKLTGSLGCRGDKQGRNDRRLSGRTKGRFRITGNYGAVTVHRATFRVADRCNGSTLFRARRGKIRVRDFEKKQTVVLRKGERYVAGARGR